MSVDTTTQEPAAAISRHRRLSGGWYVVLLVASSLAMLTSAYQLFNFGIYLGSGFTLLMIQYIYLLLLLLRPLVCIYWPAYAGAPRDRVPWYDAVLFVVTIGVTGYFAYNAEIIIDEAWEYDAPDRAVLLGYLFWILVLEATRRAGGTGIFVIVSILSLYPFVASKLPDVLLAHSPDYKTIAMNYAMGEQAILGIPMRAFGNLVIGFLIFGVALQHTGGVLMPPIMGATAFVMATFLEVPYVEIAIVAILPSVMYFFGLFMQIDAYAARNQLRGLPREELPSLGETLKEGWYFIAVFVLLIWMLVALRRETVAPYYATVALIIVNQIFKHHRWGRSDLLEFIASVGRLFAELTAILAGIGLIVGALIVTGKIGNIANDLLQLAGGSVVLLLLMGAFTSFVLGVGMTVTAAYIFLAISLAPALIQGGMDPMAVHLFILYWGMLSYITPPVALGAYAAAPIAGAQAMRTGLQAMRLGSIIYFIPFFFVLDPSFIWRGDLSQTALVFTNAMIGIVFIAAGLQGYLLFVGTIGARPIDWLSRGALIIGGLLLALPRNEILGQLGTNLGIYSAAALVVGVLSALAFKPKPVLESAD